MKTTLYIIRHGKTQASLDYVYCGMTDLALCKDGVSEILGFVKDGIYNQNVQAFYTSGLKRAVETLQLIYGDVDYNVIPELAEMNFGIFELHSHEELKNNDDYISWISDESGNIPCPQGESTNKFYERVDKGIQLLFHDIYVNKSHHVAVTSHGGCIGYFARNYIDKNLSFYDSMPSQGRGYEVEVDIANNGDKIDVLSWKKI